MKQDILGLRKKAMAGVRRSRRDMKSPLLATAMEKLFPRSRR
jgi:hypothetical protein